MNMFFEFMSMILKIHMLKIYLSIILKNASRFLKKIHIVQKNKVGFKQMKYWILKIFLVNGHPNFSYALSTSKVKIIIY